MLHVRRRALRVARIDQYIHKSDSVKWVIRIVYYWCIIPMRSKSINMLIEDFHHMTDNIKITFVFQKIRVCLWLYSVWEEGYGGLIVYFVSIRINQLVFFLLLLFLSQTHLP